MKLRVLMTPNSQIYRQGGEKKTIRRYMLRVYISSNTGSSPEATSWPGEPSAAITRAFVPLGGSLRRRYARDLQMSLLELRDPYGGENM